MTISGGTGYLPSDPNVWKVEPAVELEHEGIHEPVAFPFDPDWAHGVTEQREWLTDVIESHRGGERRASLRSRPRIRVRFQTVQLNSREVGLLDNILWATEERKFWVPLWMHHAQLSAEALAGSDTLVLHKDRGIDGWVMVWESPFRYQIAYVQSATGPTITLASLMERNYPAWGTLVVPVRPGILNARVEIDRLNEFADRVEVNFLTDEL
jgi:hypothetical protein